jgi:hypothetical protein
MKKQSDETKKVKWTAIAAIASAIGSIAKALEYIIKLF